MGFLGCYEEANKNEIEVAVAGYNDVDRLFIDPRIGTSGAVTGITFRFSGEGPWVVSIDDLRRVLEQVEAGPQQVERR